MWGFCKYYIGPIGPHRPKYYIGPSEACLCSLAVSAAATWLIPRRWVKVSKYHTPVYSGSLVDKLTTTDQ